jgi:hypothetical protein
MLPSRLVVAWARVGLAALQSCVRRNLPPGTAPRPILGVRNHTDITFDAIKLKFIVYRVG